MELKYFEEARLNKCLIVSACGFDSIPSEMGVVMLQAGFQRTGFPPDYLAIAQISLGELENPGKGLFL